MDRLMAESAQSTIKALEAPKVAINENEDREEAAPWWRSW
jgi:hypothetical protein